jgi:hypothetical protein
MVVVGRETFVIGAIKMPCQIEESPSSQEKAGQRNMGHPDTLCPVRE